MVLQNSTLKRLSKNIFFILWLNEIFTGDLARMVQKKFGEQFKQVDIGSNCSVPITYTTSTTTKSHLLTKNFAVKLSNARTLKSFSLECADFQLSRV